MSKLIHFQSVTFDFMLKLAEIAQFATNTVPQSKSLI